MGALVALALAGAVQAIDANAAVGRWQTETRHGIVEIRRCGNSICGTLESSDGIRANPDLADTKNKDAALRGRRLAGLQILGGFKWSGNQWSGGTIYNAEDGGTYSATISLPDRDHLKMKGCIVWPLCKSQRWTRVN